MYQYDSICIVKLQSNVFQNLFEGGALWKEAFGKDFEDYLSESDVEELNLYIQQRHLLSHREGLVDEDYIRKSGDQRYIVGQRIVVSEPAVRSCLDLVRRLGTGMQKDASS